MARILRYAAVLIIVAWVVTWSVTRPAVLSYRRAGGFIAAPGSVPDMPWFQLIQGSVDPIPLTPTVDGRLTLSGIIDGQACGLALDTGSSAVAISDSLAERIGCPSREVIGSQYGYTGTHGTYHMGTRPIRISFSGRIFVIYNVIIIPQLPVGESGLIGWPIIKMINGIVDMRTVTITNPSPLQQAALRASPAPLRPSVLIRLRDPEMLPLIDGSIEGVPGSLLLDSGSVSMCLFASTAQRLHCTVLEAPARGGLDVFGEITKRRYALMTAHFSIGGTVITVQDPEIIPDQAHSSAIGLVSCQALMAMHATIDASTMMLRIDSAPLTCSSSNRWIDEADPPVP
jgi:hypothetical protein